MEYRSYQWCIAGCRVHRGHDSAGYSAEEVIEWVNDNGGEAQFEPGREGLLSQEDYREPRIRVRTKDGWKSAAPGWYVVMGEEWFCTCSQEGAGNAADVRDFHPVVTLTEDRA